MHISRVFRSAAVRLLAVSVVLLSVGLTSLQLSSATPVAAQPTTGTTIGDLEYSRERTADNNPVISIINFQFPVGEVWVSFEVKNWTPGTRISRIVRFNGEDALFGDLACCSRADSRQAFRIGVAQYNSLAEGKWDVYIYVNGVQAAVGGFQVRSFGPDDRKLTTAASSSTTSTTTTSTSTTSSSSSNGNDGGGNGNDGGGNGNGGNGNN
jgi:hypothetical protein